MDRIYLPCGLEKGVSLMPRRKVMSEDFKIELAKELGFYDTVKQEGWGGIKSRDAGNMVKRAIEMAQEKMSSDK